MKMLFRVVALVVIAALSACGQQEWTASNGDKVTFKEFNGLSVAGGVMDRTRRDPRTGQEVLVGSEAVLMNSAVGGIIASAAGGSIGAAINSAAARDIARDNRCESENGCGNTYIQGSQAVSGSRSDSQVNAHMNVNAGGCTTCGLVN